MNRTPLVATSALLFSLLLASCSKPTAQDKIQVRDNGGFDTWIADHQNVLSADELRELNDARQQIRYKIMQQKRGLPSEELDAEFVADINGKTPREVLIESYEIQADRERVELQNYEAVKEKTKTTGENVTADDQKKFMKEQLDRLDRLAGEHRQKLEQFEKRLAELKKSEPAKS